MITATGNNFGASEITFKDYQTEDMVILNGTIDFHPSDSNYKAAEVLEIYVPSLLLKRSLETVIYLKMDRGEDETKTYRHDQYCTIVKSWIKDENTICVEKISLYDDCENLSLIFTSIFLPSNKRVPMTKFTKIDIKGASEQYGAWLPNGQAVIQDGWVFLHIDILQASYQYEQVTWEITFDNLPDDLECDIPIPGGNNPYGDKGLGYSQGKLKNKVLTIEKRPFGYGSTAYDPFVLGYFVR